MRSLLLLIAALVVLAACTTQPTVTSTTGQEVDAGNSITGQTNTVASTYSLEEVVQHATSGDCWTAINGQVYDVTDWIGQHPGGPQSILQLCGTDGSALFDNKHGGQARPQQELDSFLIGNLS